MKITSTIKATIIAISICQTIFAQDIGVDSILTPATGSSIAIGQQFNFVARIKNYGSTTIPTTTSIYFYIKLGTNVPLKVHATFGVACPPGATTTAIIHKPFVFNSTVPTGISTMCAWTELTGDVNNSNDTSCVTFTIVSAGVGVTEENEALKNVYYSNGKINFRITDHNQPNIVAELYNITGQLILSTIINNEDVLDASNFEKGIYVIRLRSKDNELLGTKKIFID